MPRFIRTTASLGRRRLWLLALLLVSSCSPNSTAPSVLSAAGTWTGEATLTSVAGGECLGVLFNAFVGNGGPYNLTIAQTGDRLTSTIDGCGYAGTATASSLTLASGSCPPDVQRDLPCQAADGGGTRDLAFNSRTFTGTISGNSMSLT